MREAQPRSVPMSGPRSVMWLAWVGAGLTIVYVVGHPLQVSPYPMMTDFPFHVASASVFRHLSDPAWHFSEQFSLRPFAVPYLSLYGLSALFMVVLTPVAATKLATAILLSLMPIGLMTLCWGMRKSPLLGLWGLVPVWGVLAHWGFINFLGAIGLFAACVGLGLRAVDRPTPQVQVALVFCLLALFFTHVFRFPFVLGALLLIAVAMARQVETTRGLLIPGAAAAGLFVVWWFRRPGDLRADIDWVWPPAWPRVGEWAAFLTDAFVRGGEDRAFAWAALCFAITVAVLSPLAISRMRSKSDNGWIFASHGIVVAFILAALGLFLVLPMAVGSWWYVFPRELTLAVFLVPALLPNLPRNAWAHLVFVVWTAIAVVPLARVTAEAHRDFGADTEAFREILHEIPQAPKLLYLVYDHGGSHARSSPYVHLPAYVQAERGGWLSFHFADFGASPVQYRARAEEGALVPPEVPTRWEWTPQQFRVEEHGAFFDWFLVRRRSPPDEVFAADPTIRRVAQIEDWWLYRREGGSTGPPIENP